MRHLIQLLCCFVIAAPSVTALAGNPSAKEHVVQGTKLYGLQQYDKAAAEYQAAYQLDPRPEYLYAIAQSQRLAGDCTKAVDSYRAYLATEPSADQRVKAEKNMERCLPESERLAPKSVVANLDISGQSADTELPSELPAPPPPPPTETTTPSQPSRRFLVSYILAGAGVAAIGGGAYFYRKGHNTIEAHNNAPTYEEFLATKDAADRAAGQQTLGVSAMAVGTGLVIGGVVYYVLQAREPSKTTVSAQIQHDGTMVILGRSF